MAMHKPHPGRQCRSVSFDDGKRCVIATDLDPEVDPLKLKPVVGRPPTPRPSRTDCTTSSSPDGLSSPDEFGECSSRPHSAASAAAAAQQPPTTGSPPKGKSLEPELLMMRLTLECNGLADKDRAVSMPARQRERGEGHSDDERDVDKPATEDLTSEGGSSV